MYQIDETKAREFLDSSPVAHIGVISEGEPYVTPMSFVTDGNRIIFRTKPGRRFFAIEENPVVSIEVSRYNEENGDWTSVIVQGKATEVDDNATIQLTLEKLFHKYRKALGSPLGRGGMQPLSTFPHVVVVEIEEISGMASSGPFSPRTRPGRL